jgi:hypothetical protein
MYRFAVRGFIVIPALAALMILAAGCSSSGHTSPPKASPTATHSTPSSTSGTVAAACHRIQATLAKAPSTLGSLALHPSSAKSQVTAFIDKLKTEAATAGSPALKSAVNDFASSVQKALASAQSNPGSITSLISQLTKDSQRIATACKNATG